MPTPIRAHAGLPGVVTAALLSGDLDDVTQTELDAAADYVVQSIAAMPDTMRLGVRTVSAGAGLLLMLLGGRAFGRLAPQRQRELARRLSGLPLPGVGEFVRLTRGLGLVAVFEGRSGAEGRR